MEYAFEGSTLKTDHMERVKLMTYRLISSPPADYFLPIKLLRNGTSPTNFHRYFQLTAPLNKLTACLHPSAATPIARPNHYIYSFISTQTNL